MAGMDQVWVAHKMFLREVEDHIHASIDSEVDLINKVALHILDSGGKRIRPLLLSISASLCGRKKALLVLSASILEYIHTATLLHDDVIDNAEIRRGISSARVMWGNQASILVGDYLYTLALCSAVKMDNIEINNLLANTCHRMAEGETLQLSENNNLSLTEATYLKIIEKKTALLISTSCRLGAILSDPSEDQKEALTRYGKNLGIAFQVADDTLDYVADGERLGKSLGEDLKEGKITLPLLHLLKNCRIEEKEWVEKMMVNGAFCKEDLAKVVALMRGCGSIQYALDKARHYSECAKRDLSVFQDSPYRQSLYTVADYVVTRDH